MTSPLPVEFYADLTASGSPIDFKTSRLIRLLEAVAPAQITGKNLAQRLEFSGNAHAALCFHFLRANEALAPCGLAIRRSGGAPHDTYFITSTPGETRRAPAR